MTSPRSISRAAALAAFVAAFVATFVAPGIAAGADDAASDCSVVTPSPPRDATRLRVAALVGDGFRDGHAFIATGPQVGWNLIVDEDACKPGRGFFASTTYLRRTLGLVGDVLWAPKDQHPFRERLALHASLGRRDGGPFFGAPLWEIFVAPGVAFDGDAALGSVSGGALFLAIMHAEARVDYRSKDHYAGFLLFGFELDLGAF